MWQTGKTAEAEARGETWYSLELIKSICQETQNLGTLLTKRRRNLIMSQFLTINKLEGHMIVKQGVFVVKVSKYFCPLLHSGDTFMLLQISIPRTSSDTGIPHFFQIIKPLLCSGGYNGLLIQTRNFSVIGNIHMSGFLFDEIRSNMYFGLWIKVSWTWAWQS